MDPIELMAITPGQINRALGTDRVKVVRGNRKVYMARQSRIRRGLEPESEPEDQTLEIRPISRCTDVACCGGRDRRMTLSNKHKATKESQTDPVDLSHYWDTKAMLKRLNLTILTGKPRDIQDGVVRKSGSRRSIEIQHAGTSATTGAQVDMRRPNDQSSKIGRFFRKPFQAFARLIKNTLPPDTLPSPMASPESGTPVSEPEERDHEWMAYTSSEKSRDDVHADYDRYHLNHPPKQTRIRLECNELMTVMKPLWWILKFGGRWPFQTYVEDRLFKFRQNRWAPGFFAFILTTIFLILGTSIGMINIFQLVQVSNLTGSYNAQVEMILFNKYWPYAFVTLMYGFYAVLWSLATIFDDGHFLAQFMSRWNLGVVAIRFDPCELARYEMWLSLGWLIFYFSSMIGLFVYDLVPAVRGTSGLLGNLILRPFVRDETLSKNFFAVRVFGFVFHLYTVYCARAITLCIIMYCKFLENLARLWNLRFCYVFGMLGRRKARNTYVTYHTVIPFTKLFAEHKLITDFSRYTGRIFGVTLLFYFILKGLEMVTVCYYLCAIILFPEDQGVEPANQTSLPCEAASAYCDEKIMYKDEPVFHVMSILYFTCQSLFGWYITTEGISDCGKAVMSGWTFVRRLGFPRCKNSKERRFIQSMYFTFSPTLDYYINVGFDIKINRRFIYNMFALVFVGVTTFVLYSPFRLQPQLVTSCIPSGNDTLICSTTTVPRSTASQLAEENPGTESSILHPTLIIAPPGPPPEPIAEPIPEPPAEPLPEPPAEPIPEPPGPPYIPPYIPPPPVIRKGVKDYHVCLKCGSGSAKCVIPIMCDSSQNKIAPLATSKKSTAFCPYRPGPGHVAQLYPDPFKVKLYSCSTTRPFNATASVRDDCGNLPFSSGKTLPSLMPVTIKIRDAYFNCCCYQYSWYSKLSTSRPWSGAEGNNCNMMNAEQANAACSTSSGKCQTGLKKFKKC